MSRTNRKEILVTLIRSKDSISRLLNKDVKAPDRASAIQTLRDLSWLIRVLEKEHGEILNEHPLDTAQRRRENAS